MTRPRSALRPRRALAAGALVGALLAGILPAPPPVAAAPVPAPFHEPAPAPVADLPAGEPSIAYEEWLAHEADDPEFTPGDIVTVGFRPRKGDRWQVGGSEPVPLPAGRATGREMARMPNGSTWTSIGRVPLDRDPSSGSQPPADGPTGALPPVDAPSGGFTLPATRAAFSEPAPEPAFDLAAASGLRRQVHGFLPYWELSGAATKLNYDLLSTIAYFSVGATAKGNLKKKDADGTSTTGWGGWTSSSMTQVINAAHGKGTRVVLTVSVFAWTSNQAKVQRAILGSASARLNLVRQTVAAVRDRGADGVNLDFEPLAKGYEDEFVALLRTFRAEFNKVKPGYQIVYDTTGRIGNYPLERSVGKSAADAIFVMGYDYRTAGSSTAGSIDPLSGTGYDLADTVRAFTRRVSPSRIILGIPWYGRAWSTASDKVRAKNISGQKHGYSRAVNYETVVDYVARYGRRWDAAEQSPYVVFRRRNCTDAYGCVTSWRQIYYDDAASMKRRYALVNDYDLRGTGMWALGYDGGHSSLYKALAESFLVDKAAPTAGVASIAATQVDEGFVVRWKGRDASTIVSYDVQVSVGGGAWRAWLAGTKATSEVYLGTHGKAYAFRVRAKDSKGNLGSWDVASTWVETPKLVVGGFGRVARDGLSYRTGPSAAAARLGKLPAGTIVALTRGPVSRDGFTWFEVTQPVKEWSPVSFVERGVWIAVKDADTTFVKPYRAPNSTIVKAGIRGLDFGASGMSAVGTGIEQVAGRAFSPNGDGTRDSLRLRWTNAAALESLVLHVYRTDGTLVGTRSVAARDGGTQAWSWNGRLGDTRVKDGRYVLMLEGSRDGRTYRAPSARPVTAAQVASYGVRIDTVAPSVTAASARYQLISPDGDGFRDSTKLAIAASGATRWSGRIRNDAGAVVRSASGSGGSGSFTWTGLDGDGKPLPDGRYTATIAVADDAGNVAAKTWGMRIDTTAPKISPAASPAAFSPNGDGAADTTALSWTADEPATGTVRLLRGSAVVRSWKVTDAAAWKRSWDGRRADGTRVSDGTYTLRVTLTDRAGNRRTSSTEVVVDRTAAALRWSRPYFPHDGDDLRPTSKLTYTLRRDAVTSLRLYDTAGTLVRTVWTGREQAAGSRSWTWNGKLDDGSIAPQGRYVARLTVRSRYAKVDLRRSVWAAAFAVSPSATTVKPGATLTVTFTSTEPLSATPRVTFTQPGRDGVTVKARKLADGRWRAAFSVRSGAAGMATVRVSGTDADGGTNRTTIRVKVAS